MLRWLPLLILLLTGGPAAAQKISVITLPPDTIENLVGRPVVDADGTEIGLVVDLLLDREGKPRALIVDVGGFLGLGTRRVAVAWETLRFTHGDGAPRIVDDLSMNEVAAAPEYKGPDNPVQAVGPRVKDQ